MKWFSYHCPSCGDFDIDGIAQDTIACRCGRTAKRKYQIAVQKSSLGNSARWDPVVGAYVENDAQFRSLLHKGRDEESERLNKDVKLVEVDARDQEAMAELHGHSLAERQETIAQSNAARAR